MTLKLPLWKAALEKAEEAGMIGYGKLIPMPWLEERFMAKAGTLSFAAELIHFTQALKERGWFTTARNQQGQGYLILPPGEVARYVKDKLLATTRQNGRNAAGMSHVDVSGLSPEEQKKHAAMQDKAALACMFGMRLVRMQKALPATPEMTMKTLKGLF